MAKRTKKNIRHRNNKFFEKEKREQNKSLAEQVRQRLSDEEHEPENAPRKIWRH
jgi:hypothetical protein